MGTVKYTGPVASFHCPTNAEIRSLKVHFSPKQLGEGTPSPENIRPIEGWEGVEVYRNGSTINYEFGVLGKNKFNWNVPVSESSPVSSDAATAREFTLDTYVIGMSVNNYYRQNYTNWVLNPSVENGVISFSSNAASGYGIAFPLKLAAGQTYFLSGTGNGLVGATYYNENGELISYQNGRLNKTITIPENTVTTLIGFYASTSNTDFTFSNIQLELGSTATAYEPYDPNHTVYGGWVDLITGEVREEWGSLKCGDLSWYRSTTTNTYYYYEATISNKARTKEAMCAKYKSHDVSRSNLQNYDLGYYYPSETYYHRIAIRDDTYNDLESFISDNTNTLIYYEVTTPIIYQLAPTQLQTFLGQNNVWSNADYVEVEYDLHETQTILARKQFIIANQPHIVKPAAAPLQNFVTDMAAPLKECKVYFSPVQDTSNGAPSPDNICLISGWTGLEVYRTGKNLCSRPEGGGDYMPLLIPIDTYVTASSNIGGNVTLQSSVDGSFLRYSQVSKDGNRKYEVTFDVPENKDTYRFNRQSASQNCQLELGPAATAYEPYTGITIQITFPSEAGTVYGGYVDLVTGEVVKEWHSFLMDGDNYYVDRAATYDDVNDIAYAYSYIGDGRNYGLSNLPAAMPLNSGQVFKDSYMIKCDKLIVGPNNKVECVQVAAGDQYIRLCLKKSRLSDVTSSNAIIQSMKEWLHSNPLQILYRLNTPQIVATLTPTQLKTLRGTNNIWSNANGNIELKYWTH